jgi:hypothetical protein
MGVVEFSFDQFNFSGETTALLSSITLVVSILAGFRTKERLSTRERGTAYDAVSVGFHNRNRILDTLACQGLLLGRPSGETCQIRGSLSRQIR